MLEHSKAMKLPKNVPLRSAAMRSLASWTSKERKTILSGQYRFYDLPSMLRYQMRSNILVMRINIDMVTAHRCRRDCLAWERGAKKCDLGSGLYTSWSTTWCHNHLELSILSGAQTYLDKQVPTESGCVLNREIQFSNVKIRTARPTPNESLWAMINDRYDKKSKKKWENTIYRGFSFHTD